MYLQICLANCNKVQEGGLKNGMKTKDQVCEKTNQMTFINEQELNY